MELIKQELLNTVKTLFGFDINAEVSRCEPQHGDFATNVGLQVANRLKQNPRDVSQKITEHIKSTNPPWLGWVSVAGPGFINFKLKDNLLLGVLENIYNRGSSYGKLATYQGQSVLVEYLDPNPFKELHIGHAYSGTVGDAIAHLFENADAKVHRLTYQGDIGLHVAKAIYGIMHKVGGDFEKMNIIAEDERSGFLGECYALGAKAYDEDEQAKLRVVELNKKIYDQNDDLVNKIYETGKSWSMEYFDQVYALFNFSTFEKNYMESAVVSEGVKIVNEHIADGIFKKSQGAIIFEGEEYGLHTRVYINSQGLPTYDAKDLGNAMLKWRDYNYDKSVIITGNEQSEYFKVMLKALEQFAPEQAKRTLHIAHGMVRLSTGKMSSRTGDVVRALDLLSEASQAARELANDPDLPTHGTALAAIKYAFLKNRIGGDLVYDINESLSLEGNSGPYIQYAHARASSILAKSNSKPKLPSNLTTDERLLTNKLSEYLEVVQSATEQILPHLVCTYLYELAQDFNRFYEHNRIIGDIREPERLLIASCYATVLKNGLNLLRIQAPDRM